MKPHILFNSDLDSPDQWRMALSRHLVDFEFSIGSACARPDTVDVALLWKLPSDGLAACTRLKVIISLGAGIDQLDPAGLPRGIPVVRLVDASLTRTMVEYAKTAVWRHLRGFHRFERRAREGKWQFEPPKSARHAVIGVLGLGELGGEIARALAAEGMQVHGWSRGAKSLPGVQTWAGRTALTQMVSTCDVVINVLPLTSETRSILDRNLFQHFRSKACLVNIGRGPHLVEADLLEALEAGRIEAATLDVFMQEPLPMEHPFWNHPAILVTPHVAGLSDPDQAARMVADNIGRAMRGEPLLHVVQAERGY